MPGHAQKVTSKSLESVSRFFFSDRKEAEKELGKVQVVQKLGGVLHICLKDCCTVFYQKHSKTIKQLYGCTVLYWLALFNWLHMLGILICKLFTASCTLGCGCQTSVKDHQPVLAHPCAITLMSNELNVGGVSTYRARFLRKGLVSFCFWTGGNLNSWKYQTGWTWVNIHI